MQRNNTINSAYSELFTQGDRIADLLKSRGYGQWVQLWEILDLQPRIVDIGTRIFELRHKRDLNIQNEKFRVNGVTRSKYRLLPGSWKELRGKPEPQFKAVSRQERALEFERKFAVRSAPIAATSDMPLFAGSSL